MITIMVIPTSDEPRQTHYWSASQSVAPHRSVLYSNRSSDREIAAAAPAIKLQYRRTTENLLKCLFTRTADRVIPEILPGVDLKPAQQAFQRFLVCEAANHWLRRASPGGWLRSRARQRRS
jgi:hypothetical protein